jgi:hypothetical protein
MQPDPQELESSQIHKEISEGKDNANDNEERQLDVHWTGF